MESVEKANFCLLISYLMQPPKHSRHGMMRHADSERLLMIQCLTAHVLHTTLASPCLIMMQCHVPMCFTQAAIHCAYRQQPEELEGAAHVYSGE